MHGNGIACHARMGHRGGLYPSSARAVQQQPQTRECDLTVRRIEIETSGRRAPGTPSALAPSVKRESVWRLDKGGPRALGRRHTGDLPRVIFQGWGILY